MLFHLTNSPELVGKSAVANGTKWAFEGKLVAQDPSDEPASVLLQRIRAVREASAPGNGSRTKKKAPIKANSAPIKRQRKRAPGP